MMDIAILQQAVDTWGVESQVIMAMEEMAELTVALSHAWRGREANVIEEIADVQIMLDEMKLIFGESAVNQAIGEKLSRLKKRLDNADKPFDYQAKNIEASASEEDE
jgi:hypothetical protein